MYVNIRNTILGHLQEKKNFYKEVKMPSSSEKVEVSPFIVSRLHCFQSSSVVRVGVEAQWCIDLLLAIS